MLKQLKVEPALLLCCLSDGTPVQKLQVDGFLWAQQRPGDGLHDGSRGIGPQLVVLYQLQNQK